MALRPPWPGKATGSAESQGLLLSPTQLKGRRPLGSGRLQSRPLETEAVKPWGGLENSPTWTILPLFHNSTSPTFLLTGVPAWAHSWISNPFCCLYLTALSGNSLILFVVLTEPTLQEPMYYFPSMLSTTDISLCISAVVTVLGILWLNAKEINFNACLSQMFFIRLFTFMESSVLLAMAFDRYVAISNPLRYAAILTHARIAQIGLAVITRATVILTPLVLLLKHLTFCHSHVLHHSYCFHPDVMKLSCSDTKINSAFGLTAIISTAGVDSIFILLSYVLIICSVLSIASPRERKKAFGTCISHITAVAIFYIPLISLSFVHRFGKHTPPFVPTLTANVYLLIPPVMNPIIYSVKTKQIQKAILRLVYCKGPHVLQS
ncbi:olfactory receptor 51F1 [Cricetulus griseus]|uniref:Olfactory receptor n=2 Tax=Cricetulus griseus TaxID=10029 RepID=A0A9J7FMA5_CRIGR|nr:olfactory receptor 51F1 [Cricetulus griseus]